MFLPVKYGIFGEMKWRRKKSFIVSKRVYYGLKTENANENKNGFFMIQLKASHTHKA